MNQPPVTPKPATSAKSPATPAAKAKAPLAKPAPAQTLSIKALLKLDPVGLDVIADDATARRQMQTLLRRLTQQTVLIAVLSGLFVAASPFFQPFYQYYAVSPDKQVTSIVPLNLPNLTNRAILSWAANSVTEILTIGFGDFDKKLGAQRIKFTSDGWDAFAHAFLANKIDQSFRQHQLVLTTVPSNTPVITAQGENEDHIYQWKVQMPVIMTFATNNNKTNVQPAVVELTIIRVPYKISPSGIAIDSWRQVRQ